MAQEFIANINGKRWKIRTAVSNLAVRGDCDAPDVKNKQIRVAASIADDEQFCEILTHEILHAADWHRSEEWITSTSKSIANILKKCNFRRVCDD